MLCDGPFRRVTRLVHRLVAIAFIPNPASKPSVDHINGDKVDNRVTNLRWSTPEENLRNQRRRKSNTSGCIGVSFDRRTRKFHAYISMNLKRRHLGVFATIDEAARVSVTARRAVFGEFFNDNHYG
jgi:hypothetical protein